MHKLGEYIHIANRCFFACAVAVITHIQSFRHAGKLSCLPVGKSRAHTRNGILYAARAERYDVHIALDQNQLFIGNAVHLFVALYKVDAVYRASFVEKRGVCGVFVFCNVLFAVINTSAESNDVAHAVHNRHDNSVCKSVVRSLSVANKSALLQIFEQISFATHISDHALSVKRKPQTVTLCRLVVKGAIVQILSCLLALVFIKKIVAIIPCHIAHKLFQNIRMFLLFGVFGIELNFGQLHPHLVGKQLHGVVKRHGFHFHYKLDDIAGCTASETMIPAVVYAKRSGFFIVKRTAPEIASAFFLQGNVLRNDFHYVAFVFKFLQKFGSKTACHNTSS